jgi:hypothetical protein
MTIFKAEVYVELRYDSMCCNCPFHSGQYSDNKSCSLADREWEAEVDERPEWCPLKEVKVMR